MFGDSRTSILVSFGQIYDWTTHMLHHITPPLLIIIFEDFAGMTKKTNNKTLKALLDLNMTVCY